MIKETEKKAATPIINPDTGLEVKKNVSISFLYIPNLTENLVKSLTYKCTGHLQRSQQL